MRLFVVEKSQFNLILNSLDLVGMKLELLHGYLPHLSQIKGSASLNPLLNLPFSLFEPLFRQQQCVVRIRKYIISLKLSQKKPIN